MSWLLALLSLSLPLSSSEPPPQRFRDRLEVTEVVVNAVVTDRRGRPVTGLEAADFLVREEGRPVDVLSAQFHPWSLSPAAEMATEERPVRLPLVAAGRRFILVFHDLRRSDRETLGVASHQLRAGRDVRRWLQGGLAPGDLAAVVSYDYRLKIHQDFTADRDSLGRAITRAVGRRPELEAAPAPGAPSLLGRLPAGRERRDRSASLREALKLLARAVQPVSGRKTLLLFSVGVGLDGPERGLFGPSDEPTLVERLNDADLAVYCLDTTPPTVEHSLADTLGALADNSGGEYFGHIERFQTTLQQIESRLQGYYLLTYATPASTGGYRRIEVSTRDRHLVVKSRRGYLATDRR